jgi:pimeloyl-ACP methyl ester carboxylesterase
VTTAREIDHRVDGRRLRLLVVDGEAPNVLLLHGSTDSADSYRPLLDDIAGRHAAMAVELRGHGGSDEAVGYELHDYAADVVTLLEDADLRPAILVGHSLGAMIAMFVASTRPELVAGIVLEDPPYFALLDPQRNHEAPWYAGWVRMRELLAPRHDAAEFRAGVAELPAMLPDPSLLLREVLSKRDLGIRTAVLRRVDARVLDPVTEDRLVSRFPAEALQIRCPAALIAGCWRLGGAMTGDDVLRWLDCVPHGTATILGDTGHLLHHQPASRRAVVWQLQEVARQAGVGREARAPA